MEALLREIYDLESVPIAVEPLSELRKHLNILNIKLDSVLEFNWARKLLGQSKQKTYEIENNDDFYINEIVDPSDHMDKTLFIRFNNCSSTFGKVVPLGFYDSEEYGYACKYLKKSKNLSFAITQYKMIEILNIKIQECKANIELYNSSPHLIYLKYFPKAYINTVSSNELIQDVKYKYGWEA